MPATAPRIAAQTCFRKPRRVGGCDDAVNSVWFIKFSVMAARATAQYEGYCEELFQKAINCKDGGLPASGVGPEGFMDAFDGHPAFAYGGGAAFDGAGTDVAGGEDAGVARLQRAR